MTTMATREQWELHAASIRPWVDGPSIGGCAPSLVNRSRVSACGEAFGNRCSRNRRRVAGVAHALCGAFSVQATEIAPTEFSHATPCAAVFGVCAIPAQPLPLPSLSRQQPCRHPERSSAPSSSCRRRPGSLSQTRNPFRPNIINRFIATRRYILPNTAIGASHAHHQL